MTVLSSRPSAASAVVLSGLLLGLAVFFFLVMRSGSEARAIERAQWASDMEKENEAFCRKFGLAPGSNQFTQCAADVSKLRKLHEERVVKDAAGIL